MKDPASWVTDDWHGGVEEHRRQRADNGYSRADWINFDTYLAWIIAKAARDFGKHHHPSTLSPEEWKDLLNEMADGFEVYLKYEVDGEGDYADAYERLRNSLDILQEYFTSLWD